MSFSGRGVGNAITLTTILVVLLVDIWRIGRTRMIRKLMPH